MLNMDKYPKFKISYSFSGILLEQLQECAPEVLRSFQKLVNTGNVEVLDETYYHSLAFMYSKPEFITFSAIAGCSDGLIQTAVSANSLR